MTFKALLGATAVGATGLVAAMATGKVTLDTGLGRSTHQLGPIVVPVAAPRDLVFEQISSPYLGRTPKSLKGHIQIHERTDDMVVASHFSKVYFYTSETVESVRFERPDKIHFRHLRGPVPHAVEVFELAEDGDGTIITYRGEIGLDWWIFGQLAARYAVIPQWEGIVTDSLAGIKEGAETRAAARVRRAERKAARNS